MRADQISQEVYQTVVYTEQILSLNPALASLPIIPEDTLIKLPIIEEKTDTKGINLWS